MKKAFSLIELSVVLVIISILITGTLSISISAVNNARYKSTKDKIDSIYAALGNYVLLNGKLPCPAPLNIAEGSANYAKIDATSTDGVCTEPAGVIAISTNLAYGSIPSVDLGLLSDNAADSFSSKFSYVVDIRLTNSATFDDELQNNGSGYVPLITVLENPAATSILADFLIISHGANKYGAYGARSSTAIASNGNADEDDNDSTSLNANFVARSDNDDEFDDIVMAKKITDLLQDFDMLDKIKCPAESLSLYGATMSWSEADYGQEAISTTSCPIGFQSGPSIATRKCLAYGQWGSIITPCIQD